ncbi:50S ribosomal protein L24 [Candidatus Woesearchaeota archaeon CG_4_10_14_0_2_um_filter_33_13]|nr:MAG: 50S ribosomal protein L24 [Candidatus Woesearchaeota archaeon CG_4_10_14_0_2_um_filter_33_13]
MVKASFVKSWNKSVQPRKQRKYVYNAPLHVKQKLVHVHLSAELRKKYGLRNAQLKKGDKVKVLRGQFKKQDAKVDRVDLKRERVYLAGIDSVKKDGTKLPLSFRASNLMIIEPLLTDKKRKQKFEKKTQKPTVEKKTEVKK